MTQELTAIDIHVHPADETHVKFLGRFYEHAQKYFRRKMEVVSLDETADYYRSLNMMAVLLALDCESNFGTPPVSNDHVAAAVRKHPDVFMGFGSVDPWKGKRALQEVDRLRDLGLLEKRGKAAGTFYRPTARLLEPESPHVIVSPPATATTTESQGQVVVPNAQSQGLESLSQGLESLSQGFESLPQELTEAVQALGKRATPTEAKLVVRLLCAWKPMQAEEIAHILGREQRYVTRTYLGPMVRDEELAYTFPDNPAHPQQAYRATATDDLDDAP